MGGIYDLEQDSDGRWSAEKFRGLMFQMEREANVIAKELVVVRATLFSAPLTLLRHSPCPAS